MTINKQQETFDEVVSGFTDEQERACSIAMMRALEQGGTMGNAMAACIAASRSDDVERGLEQEDVEKRTFRDQERALREALTNKYGGGGVMGATRFVYLEDFDNDFVYYEIDGNLYREGYTAADAQAELADDAVEANRETLYIVEGEVAEVSIVERGLPDDKTPETTAGRFARWLNKHFGSEDASAPEFEVDPSKVPMAQDENGKIVIKQFQEEEMVAYEPLYTPPDVPDAVGDSMEEHTIIDMVDQINKAIAEGRSLENLGHNVPIRKAWKYQEAFVSPWPSCMVGDTEVVKGQPVLVVQYHNERAWELRKEGRIKGPSIGCRGTFRKVEDDS